MAEHTPGPWFAELWRDMDAEEHYAIKAANRTIADLDMDGSFPEDCANAHLIEAAPDMFAALLDARAALLVLLGLAHSERPIMQTIDAAIAKARGE